TGKIIKAALESRSGYLYFSGLSSKLPERSLRSQVPRIVGVAILRWLRDNAAELGKQQLCIVAEGATDQGIRLLDRQFGFKLISGGIGSKDPEKSKQKPRFRRTIQVSRIPDLLG